MPKYEPHPADIICFSGNGSTSRLIKLVTHWPWEHPKISHLGIIATVTQEAIESLNNFSDFVNLPQERIDNWTERLLLFESTTLTNLRCAITGELIKGVQAHGVRERVSRYNGQAYYCRLTPAYQEKFLHNGRRRRLSTYLMSRIGDTYNGRGAALSGTRLTLRIRDWFWCWSKADKSSLFCSQYVASALSPIDMFPIDDARKWNPAKLIKKLVKNGVYEPPKPVELF